MPLLVATGYAIFLNTANYLQRGLEFDSLQEAKVPYQLAGKDDAKALSETCAVRQNNLCSNFCDEFHLKAWLSWLRSTSLCPPSWCFQ